MQREVEHHREAEVAGIYVTVTHRVCTVGDTCSVPAVQGKHGCISDFPCHWLNTDRRLKYSGHLFWFMVPGGAVHLGGNVCSGSVRQLVTLHRVRRQRES